MSRRRSRAAPPESRGRWGEDLAAAFLLSRGYRLVARNLRVAGAELDLLVRRRRLYVAVEVKTRSHHPAPERFADREQLERLRRALQALAPHLRPRPRRLRVDVLAVRVQPGEPHELRLFPGPEDPWEGDGRRGFWRRRLWTI